MDFAWQLEYKGTHQYRVQLNVLTMPASQGIGNLIVFLVKVSSRHERRIGIVVPVAIVVESRTDIGSTISSTSDQRKAKNYSQVRVSLSVAGAGYGNVVEMHHM